MIGSYCIGGSFIWDYFTEIFPAQWVNHMGTPDRKTTITFETKCYENDWEYLLKTERLKKAVALCCYPFDRVVLHINNVKNPDKVARYASRLLLSGVISEFVQVSDYAGAGARLFRL